MSKPSRPKVPEAVKRKVRKKCGFGCVLCGCPIYEYEHMYGYARTRRHNADEMTLLCDRHHKEKTNGLLPLAAVERANEDPVNVAKGVSSPYGLHFSGESFLVTFGSCSFEVNGSRVVPLMVRDEEVISVKVVNGQVMLNVRILDPEGGEVMKVVDNELEYAAGLWDVEFIGQTLTIRSAPYKVLFRITFMPPSQIYVSRMDYALEGVGVHVRDEGIRVTYADGRNRDMRNMSMQGHEYCLVVNSRIRVPGQALRI